jgi:hypothetical protein
MECEAVRPGKSLVVSANRTVLSSEILLNMEAQHSYETQINMTGTLRGATIPMTATLKEPKGVSKHAVPKCAQSCTINLLGRQKQKSAVDTRGAQMSGVWSPFFTWQLAVGALTAEIFSLSTKICISLNAPSRKRRVTLTIVGHPNTVGSQDGTAR